MTGCVRGLPGAVAPLWQDAQSPAVTPWSARCLKLAGVQEMLEWQELQPAVAGICDAGLPGARPPGLWQVAQSRGVPRKVPWRWHDSQRTPTCAPSRAKPVEA